MTPEQWQKILNTFGDLAPGVYEAALRQAAVNAIMNGIALTLAIALVIAWIALLVVLFRKRNKSSDAANAFEMLLIIGGVSSLFITAGMFMAGSVVLTYLMNPEWAALKILKIVW